MFTDYMQKYSYYLDIVDRIMNMKPGEQDSLSSFLAQQIEEYNLDVSPIMLIICNMNEVRPAMLKEYWEAFYSLYHHFKIKPEFQFYSKSHSKFESFLYDMNNNSLSKINQELNSCDQLDYIMLHDDIKSLKEYVENTKDFDQMIKRSCLYGSIECFKFLRSNGAKISKKCLDYSIRGRNKQIITECLQYYEPDRHTMKKCIQIHNIEMLLHFHEYYGLEIPLQLTMRSLNLPAFLYLLSLTKDYSKFLFEAVQFGIP